MKSELENFACLFDVSVLDLSSNRGNTGNIISKLKNRVEELEDLLNEIKQKGRKNISNSTSSNFIFD